MTDQHEDGTLEDVEHHDDGRSFFDDPDPQDEHALRHRGRPRRRRVLASCLVVLVILAAVAVGAVFAVGQGIDKVKDLFAGPADYTGDGTGQVLFEVHSGDTTTAIARNLKDQGVVRSAEAFTDQAADDADLEGSAEKLGYTPGELMTIASLVEAEANRDQDRGKVARVIYNRLETDATDHKLQIDATVNYALGRDLGLGLTQQDLQVDSPYNTRRYPGLPPGPIESPGDAAIAAATNPTPGNWVYYVTVNLDTGETKFSKSYNEFLKNRQELQQWCSTSDRC